MRARRFAILVVIGLALAGAAAALGPLVPHGGAKGPGKATVGTRAGGPGRRSGFLRFAFTRPGPGGLVTREGVAGRSARGRPVRLREVGDPSLPGRVLVFGGCDRAGGCGTTGLTPRHNGCPDPLVDVFLVPGLGPGGPAADRRLAARIARRIRPRVTIWLDRGGGAPFVRAGGAGAPAGRRFARLAGIPFHLMPAPAGTAPERQSGRFAGTASLVVEMPQGRPAQPLWLQVTGAIDRIGRREARVGEDGYVAKG